MKLKKMLASIALLVVFCISIIIQNTVYAATEVTARKFKIIPLMSENPAFGYAIGDPNTNGSDASTKTAATIWNIVEEINGQSQYKNDEDIFCLREGVGFRKLGDSAEYNFTYDMKSEKANILADIYNWSKTIDGVNQYSAILAILDSFYINGQSSEEYKNELIKKANIVIGQGGFEEEAKITDDDIKAVQQAALWYFTNYGENPTLYDKTGENTTGWLNYTEDGNTYTSLSGYNPTNVDPNSSYGVQRQQQAELLYKYLIKNAKENASKYDNLTTTQITAPAVVDKTRQLSYEENGENYIVGPFKITEQENNSIDYSIDFNLKNGNTEITNYTLLNENKENANTSDVKNLVGTDFYISVPKNSMTVSDFKVSINIKYSKTTLKLWTNSTDKVNQQPLVIPEKEEITIPTELTLKEIPKAFDLSLRKYITKINGVELTGSNSRVPNIDEQTLETGETATYKHRKDPVTIVTGDKVTYKLTVYNEGEKEGRATKIIDQLPTGLKFSKVVSGNFELDIEKGYNEETNTVYLARKSNNTENLSAYTKGNLDSETIEIECEVTAEPDSKNNKILTNVAWISEEYDAKDQTIITNQNGADRDSEPSTTPNVNKDNMNNYTGNENKEDLSDSNYYYKGQQDDDDFEKLVLMPEAFDLKLIKRITAVNNQAVPERIESVDVSKLNTLDENGNMITTGEYNLNKEPVSVKQGDIVTYTFRIYNEGTLDGYASEITEDIPEGLQFIWSEKEGDELKADTTLTDAEKEAIEFNQKYLWGNFIYDDAKENIIKVSSDYLSKENETTVNGNLIKAFGKNDGTKTEKDISYKEISIKLKVISTDTTGASIRNEACISKDTDKNGNEVDDRDSSTDEWKEHPNHEDDEDHDYVALKSFDLSLRKFIVAVSKDDTLDEKDYIKNVDGSYKRAPIVDTSKLNTTDENGKLITTAEYKHTKEPILVAPNNIVVYMLRVYNEGDIDGYASEIKDHLPESLEYVDGEFNQKYGWSISEDGRTVTTRYLENSIITKAQTDENGKIVLTYKEVPIMCRVKENAKTSENITNIADITEYLDDKKEQTTDRDSSKDNVKVPEDSKLPSYKEDEKGEYVPGQEDDDDFEKVIVKIFDLALRKWVTQAIVIENGETTVTETGHQPYDDPEQIVKVELHRKKINQVTVKFRYSIRVINEGELEGYAKEITDYVPEGLKFVAEDNPNWTDEGNNVISTRALENTLLKPGEYADVDVVLTWINNENNMGVMTNTAEISEDYNEYDVPDKDSTPDNKKPGEDDIDDAPVMLSVSTGQMRIYFTLGFIVLVTVASGVALIKKYVL